MTLKILMGKLESIEIAIGLLIHNDDYFGASILHDYKIKLEKEIEIQYDKETNI
jgi:hypothetical protein